MLKLPDGTVKVLVEGTQRAKILQVLDEKSHFDADIDPVPVDQNLGNEAEAMRRALIDQFDQYVKINKRIRQKR